MFGKLVLSPKRKAMLIGFIIMQDIDRNGAESMFTNGGIEPKDAGRMAKTLWKKRWLRKAYKEIVQAAKVREAEEFGSLLEEDKNADRGKDDTN